MTDTDLTEGSHQLQGAIDVSFWLKEELAHWVEEAADESKRAALENVLAYHRGDGAGARAPLRGRARA